MIHSKLRKKILVIGSNQFNYVEIYTKIYKFSRTLSDFDAYVTLDGTSEWIWPHCVLYEGIEFLTIFRKYWLHSQYLSSSRLISCIQFFFVKKICEKDVEVPKRVEFQFIFLFFVFWKINGCFYFSSFCIVMSVLCWHDACLMAKCLGLSTFDFEMKKFWHHYAFLTFPACF